MYSLHSRSVHDQELPKLEALALGWHTLCWDRLCCAYGGEIHAYELDAVATMLAHNDEVQEVCLYDHRFTSASADKIAAFDGQQARVQLVVHQRLGLLSAMSTAAVTANGGAVRALGRLDSFLLAHIFQFADRSRTEHHVWICTRN